MSFYCVYCNRVRSGKKKTPQAQTREHFIPKSIGGRWIISVCRTCNARANESCDAYLAQISMSYRIYANKPIIATGKALLVDGTSQAADFTVEQLESGDFSAPRCVNATTRERIPTAKGTHLQFAVPDQAAVRDSHPAIAKIAVGGTCHLLDHHHRRTGPAMAAVGGLAFADLRALFLGQEFQRGGKGRGHGYRLEMMSRADAKRLLTSRLNPEVRRHYLALEDSGHNLRVTVCLYSTFFWEVTIPGAALHVGKLHDEILLHKLNRCDPDYAANVMHMRSPAPIIDVELSKTTPENPRSV